MKIKDYKKEFELTNDDGFFFQTSTTLMGPMSLKDYNHPLYSDCFEVDVYPIIGNTPWGKSLIFTKSLIQKQE